MSKKKKKWNDVPNIGTIWETSKHLSHTNVNTSRSAGKGDITSLGPGTTVQVVEHTLPNYPYYGIGIYVIRIDQNGKPQEKKFYIDNSELIYLKSI